MSDYSDESASSSSSSLSDTAPMEATTMVTNESDNDTLVAQLAGLLARLLGQFIDIDYSCWMWRILWPLIVTFLLPLVFVLLIYVSSLFLYIYKLHR